MFECMGDSFLSGALITAKQECKKGTFRRGELPERFTVRKLFR